jgi:hypothetical protein
MTDFSSRTRHSRFDDRKDRAEDGEFGEFKPSYIFQKGDIGLFSGADEALGAFAGSIVKAQKHEALQTQIFKLFHKEKKNPLTAGYTKHSDMSNYKMDQGGSR